MAAKSLGGKKRGKIAQCQVPLALKKENGKEKSGHFLVPGQGAK